MRTYDKHMRIYEKYENVRTEVVVITLVSPQQLCQ